MPNPKPHHLSYKEAESLYDGRSHVSVSGYGADIEQSMAANRRRMGMAYVADGEGYSGDNEISRVVRPTNQQNKKKRASKRTSAHGDGGYSADHDKTGVYNYNRRRKGGNGNW